MPDDTGNLFENLANRRAKKEKAEPLKETPIQPKGRAKGKRSDPNYTQIGAYIPKDLHNKVKRRLFDEDVDLSELITDLLTKWLGDESVK